MVTGMLTVLLVESGSVWEEVASVNWMVPLSLGAIVSVAVWLSAWMFQPVAGLPSARVTPVRVTVKVSAVASAMVSLTMGIIRLPLLPVVMLPLVMVMVLPETVSSLPEVSMSSVLAPELGVMVAVTARPPVGTSRLASRLNVPLSLSSISTEVDAVSKPTVLSLAGMATVCMWVLLVVSKAQPSGRVPVMVKTTSSESSAMLSSMARMSTVAVVPVRETLALETNSASAAESPSASVMVMVRGMAAAGAVSVAMFNVVVLSSARVAGLPLAAKRMVLSLAGMVMVWLLEAA